MEHRTYGVPPFTAAVIHGGPGANGELAPIAEMLSAKVGVLEPLQTALTINGQIAELKSLLDQYVLGPITLIGHSWGAWLSFVFASRFNKLVCKVILVGSSPFEEVYAREVRETRFSRMDPADRAEVQRLELLLEDPNVENQTSIFARFGELMSKADSFDPQPSQSVATGFYRELYRSIWAEAAAMRRTGRLLKFGDSIRCPVVAIHGDFDPHPAEGVEKPLASVLKNFRFELLENCGHYPWLERRARDRFFEILIRELTN